MGLYIGYLIFTTLLGLCIGSFANVLIHRLPRGESIVAPGSHCPICNTPLRVKDNIPLLSYALLRGKCRDCGAPISRRYPLVEALTAFLFVACYMRFGWGAALLPACALCAILVALTFVDLEHHLVLDSLLIAGLVIALPMNVIFSALCTWQESLLGILAGGLPLLAIALAGRLLTKRDVMGGGDIKLMAVAGAFLGWKGALLSLGLGSVLGGIVVLILLALKKIDRRQEIPFVPMLAGGIVLALLIGQPLLDWYFGMFA